MQDETYLVTGALGCIGAWVLKHLVERNAKAISADLSADPVRPRLIMDDGQIGRVDWRILDITDTEAVKALVAEAGVTRIIHLAGLQIPFCKANPPLGAAVNVVGTVNVFEAALASGTSGLAYASSLAALGPASGYDSWPLGDDAPPDPRTLYGVYKVANEQVASVYAADSGVGSVGLRPCVVYGIGRDQGVTADFAKAVLAAVAGVPFHIRSGGIIPMQHASDVARMFIGCADADVKQARICNMRNDVVAVADFVERLTAIFPDARITYNAEDEFPFPADLGDDGLQEILGDVPHTRLEDALRQDAAMYRDLLDRDQIDLEQLKQ
ncbi:MAG: NAD(P)-dependent oxidoreductase [Boseongicola sp. SB0675_bin_26]|nr:NAD(P)-dependent oxidoreductase [Boseongicola sp. SB0675_bin_26]